MLPTNTRAAADAPGVRYSLRPLFSEGTGSTHHSGVSRREIAEVYLDVIACDKRDPLARNDGTAPTATEPRAKFEIRHYPGRAQNAKVVRIMRNNWEG